MIEDDRISEQLEEQKQAYENMPKFSSAEKIIDHIESSKAGKRKFGKRFRRFLPYAAGIAAALLVTALSLSQIHSQREWEGAEKNHIFHKYSTKRAQPETKRNQNQDDQSHVDRNADDSQNDNEAAPITVGKTPKTVDQAKVAFTNMKNDGKSSEEVDAVFVKFLRSRMKLTETEQGELQKLSGNWYATFESPEEVMKQPDKIKDPQFREFVMKLKEQGLGLMQREGMLELTVPFNDYKEWFSPYVSDQMKQYLSLEANQIVLRDASFDESWNALGEQLVSTENFLTKYPDFSFNPELKSRYSRDLHIYLFGIPNKKPFDRQTGTLLDEVRQSYEKIMADYPDSTTAKIVKNYYQALKDNDWKQIPPESFEMPALPDELNPMQKFTADEVLTLPKNLSETYAQLKAATTDTQRAQLLGGLNTADTLKLFLHSVMEKDYEAEYRFFTNGSATLPSLDEFLKNENQLETFTNQVQNQLVKVVIIGESENVIAKLYFSGETEP
ncbi:MAG TPA: hypothetical protein VFK27_04490, partial [Bacillales bacterium]|nr:hypothetical protein [Bacillales bacterium]